MKETRHAGAFLLGVFVGWFVGGIAGLLLAPQAGEETREQIRSKTVDLQEAAEARVTETQEKVAEAVGEVKRRVDDLQAKGQAVVTESRKQVAEAVEGIKEAAAEADADSFRIPTPEEV